jgi:hypothetical protein
MASLVPVDNDPFADTAPQQAPAAQAPAPVASNGPQLVPVDHDPFSDQMVRVPVVAGRAGITGYRMVPQSQLDAGTTGALEDAGRVAGNGATLGTLDNAIAGGEALAGSGDYQSNLAAQHAATQQAMQRPGAQFLSNTSALAPGILGVGAAATGARLMGAGALGTYGATALASGLLSGTNAFMTSDGTAGQRLQDAEKPFAFGTGLGIAAPAIAQGAGSLLSAGAGRVMNALYDSQYGNVLPRQGADSILDTLGNQQQSVAQAGQAIQNIGPGAVLADSGPATQAQVGQLATRDMTASPTIVDNLKAREPMFDQRINNAVDQNFGPDLNAPQMVDTLKASTATNAKTAYDPIFANAKPVDVSPVLQTIDNTLKPGGPGMVGSGVDDPYLSTLQRLRGYIAGPNSQAFDMQSLHNAQQLINDAGRSANQAGNGYQAGQIWDLRKQLMGQMDQANPGYLDATKQYATDKSIQEAFDDGRNLLATRQDGTVYDPDLLRQNMANMSAPEQNAFQLGARKAVSDVMGSARSDPAGLAAKFANDNGYAVGKLRQVFGDQPVQNMLGELDNQATMRATNASAMGGSQTAIRTAANESIPGFEPTAHAAPSGGHGTVPLAMMAGEEAGRHLGTLFGHPEIGSAAGTVLGPGLSWAANKVAASSAANTAAEQAAARQGMAKALTSPGQDAVMQALTSREATSQVPINTNVGAQKVIKALMMQQAAKGQNSALYPLIPQSFNAP